MLLLDTLELNKCSRRPVWIMRQAGRYLASYRKLREKYSFDQLALQPDLATQVTMLPIQQYELDAAVVFSDILYPLTSLGVELEFTERGPVIRGPKTIKEVEALKREFDPKVDTPAILQTISNVRSELHKDKAVLGFSGAPFTMLAYLMEGHLSKDLGVLKRWLAEEPKLMKEILEHLAQLTGEYLDAQASAGADAVQLFDTWAGQLDAKTYETFALPYARQVVSNVTVPCVYYVNGVSGIIEHVAAVGAQALSVDWRVELGELRKRVSPVIALQGNLDPYHLHLPRAEIRQKVFEMCDSYGKGPGHVVNLGHGIVPSIPEDSVKYFIEAVHEWSNCLID